MVKVLATEFQHRRLRRPNTFASLVGAGQAFSKIASLPPLAILPGR